MKEVIALCTRFTQSQSMPLHSAWQTRFKIKCIIQKAKISLIIQIKTNFARHEPPCTLHSNILCSPHTHASHTHKNTDTIYNHTIYDNHFHNSRRVSALLFFVVPAQDSWRDAVAISMCWTVVKIDWLKGRDCCSTVNGRRRVIAPRTHTHTRSHICNVYALLAFKCYMLFIMYDIMWHFCTKSNQ